MKQEIVFSKSHIAEAKCPMCEKMFTIWDAKDYVYKLKGLYYCSYTCWRKAEEDQPRKARYIRSW